MEHAFRPLDFVGAYWLERALTPQHSIHDLGAIAHVEEISIRREHQSKGLGLKLIKALSSLAREMWVATSPPLDPARRTRTSMSNVDTTGTVNCDV